jgi:Gnt-I system high-affinity gluconate transporter
MVSGLLCLALLVLLIAWLRLNPFVAFLIAAIAGALMLGLSPDAIVSSLERGMGALLGSLAGILCLSAMFGKLIAESGAALQIGRSLVRRAGERRIPWALAMTGFIVGIPRFYNVGFVLLVPLVFALAAQTRLSPIYLAVPLLAALSVTHGFLPPHPSPTAIVPQFHADMGQTILLGLIVAVPAMIIAGPLLARFLRNVPSRPLAAFQVAPVAEEALPKVSTSFIVALLPIALIAAASLSAYGLAPDSPLRPWLALAGNPLVVMLVALLVAVWALCPGKDLRKVAAGLGSAIGDIAPVLLIIAGAGALKQVFVDSGIDGKLATVMHASAVNPLILGWSTAALIRVCLGSATVAGLTASGVLAPLVVANPAINPNLMVLAVGAGSVFCSHVNDSGFWMCKEYFNLSMKDTFRTWTLMESLVGIVGLVGVLVLDVFV